MIREFRSIESGGSRNCVIVYPDPQMRIVLDPGSEASPGFYQGAVSRDFRHHFFSLIEPSWVPDKQAKMVFLKN